MPLPQSRPTGILHRLPSSGLVDHSFACALPRVLFTATNGCAALLRACRLSFYRSSPRARVHGWPNAYAFTKAMGEMLLGHSKKERLPLLIFRPTIITSTFEQPFPGWMENFRTVDSIAFAYGKGKLEFFLADPRTIVDVIPVDMVVNAMIVGAAANEHRSRSSLCCGSNDPIVYSTSSSSRNPITLVSLQGIIRRYFENNPWINEDGRPVKVGKARLMSSMSTFRIYMTLRYLIPIKVLGSGNFSTRLAELQGALPEFTSEGQSGS